MSETATVDGVAAPAAVTPWYESQGLPKDDHGIYSKYKTPEDALKSIPSRERLINSNIQIPSADLKPEEQEAAHREILAKMGAPKDTSAYAISEWIKTIPKEILDATPPGYFDMLTADAKELGLLPWQLKRSIALQTKRALEMRQKAIEDAPQREQEETQKWTSVVGPKIEIARQQAENAASRLDNTLFIEQNAKMDPETLRTKGGLLVQALREANDPVLYKAMQHINDRLFVEAGQPQGSMGKGQKSAHAQAYEYAKTSWPNRGEEFWQKYAREQDTGER